ncbi:hypothetical protein [Streptomyces sp. NPDC008317]|uniref:hypothetical protein n=1 Tax=Streptomyces sp. NPDC008317 TaxID=3364827 RepID=UPI0036EEB021
MLALTYAASHGPRPDDQSHGVTGLSAPSSRPLGEIPQLSAPLFAVPHPFGRGQDAQRHPDQPSGTRGSPYLSRRQHPVKRGNGSELDHDLPRLGSRSFQHYDDTAGAVEVEVVVETADQVEIKVETTDRADLADEIADEVEVDGKVADDFPGSIEAGLIESTLQLMGAISGEFELAGDGEGRVPSAGKDGIGGAVVMGCRADLGGTGIAHEVVPPARPGRSARRALRLADATARAIRALSAPSGLSR